jgi:hypothetical protein
MRWGSWEGAHCTRDRVGLMMSSRLCAADAPCSEAPRPRVSLNTGEHLGNLRQQASILQAGMCRSGFAHAATAPLCREAHASARAPTRTCARVPAPTCGHVDKQRGREAPLGEQQAPAPREHVVQGGRVWQDGEDRGEAAGGRQLSGAVADGDTARGPGVGRNRIKQRGSMLRGVR